MRRNLALQGPLRPAAHRCASSVACLVFVAVLGVAFWAGAAWLAQLLVRISQTGS
jgi:hypothetical protein